MKKTVFFLAVLFVAGIFSAKAQYSSSDSAYARDLNYVYINTSSLPATATGTLNLSSGTKILKDIRFGRPANGYAFTVSSSGWYDIDLTATGFDPFIYLLDANYNVIDSNDDYNGDQSRSKMLTQLQAGSYYILVSRYGTGIPSSSSFTLTLNTQNVKTFSTITYTAKAFGTPIVDTLGANCELVSDSILYGNVYNAKGYTMQIPAGYMKLTYDRYNRNVLLLDNNYNFIHDFYSSVLFNVPQSGTYKLVVLSFESFDNDTSLSTFYTINTDSVSVATFRTLPYQNISFGAAISDTLKNTDPYLLSHPRSQFASSLYEMPFAKGFKIQTPASINYLDFVVDSVYFDSYIFLLDANKNLIAQNDDDGFYESRLIAQVNPSSTYYLVVSSYSYGSTGRFHFYTNGVQNLPTLYVDGVNGDDTRNGLTAGTALKTLDTAIARTQGIGKYLITDDYTFNNYNYLPITNAEIYPYGKDINLKISSNVSSDVVFNYGNLVFGEQGSNYYFILDSNKTTSYEDFLDADALGSYLEVNNLKVRNSLFPGQVFWGDELVLRNCEFTNDTIYGYFIGMEENAKNSIKFENCNISNSYIEYNFIYQDYDYMKFTLENTTIAGNTFNYQYPVLFDKATINLISGNWRNNNLSANYYYNNNANLSPQNCAGIWATDSTIVNIGAGFTMDANNYLCIDTTATVNISENLTAPLVAQIYPMKWDDGNSKYIADYYEGRRLLTGSASVLSANYSKFSVAQAASQLWYLHPDGTIHTYNVGIETADNAAVRMYPNPAADKVTVELQNTTATEICVMDIYGKTVIRQAVNSQSEVLDLGNLAKGMYFVQIRNNSKVEATQKLVKK